MQKQNKKIFDFENLFILELSKNHGGNVEHGIRTIREFAKVVKEHGVRAAIKLQFQDLDTYLHPDMRSSDDPRVKRYLTSRLSEKDFKKIVDEIHKQGLISMSTPFDETSVDMLDRLKVQIIKIASSSAMDWPLLRRIVQSGKPVVCSTGGLELQQMDTLYRFLNQNKISFSMLHCVSMYPTPQEHMQLHAISIMNKRFPKATIGFSTHEPSESTAPVQMAYALGARVFEKHIILPDEKLESNLLYYKISTYTATPEQIHRWIGAAKDAMVMYGTRRSDTYEPEAKEIETLRTMTRGVYVKKDIKKGSLLRRADVYFAIPLLKGHMSSGEWREGIRAHRSYKKDSPLVFQPKKKK